MDSKYLESMQELGLQAGFTLEELKKKWRELSKKYHSDRHAQADEVLRELADEKMKKINEAYSYLEKNFNQNTSASYNSNKGNDSDYYNDYDDYEEESYSKNYGYRREDYYFLSEEEELDYFGELLPKLKIQIEKSLKEQVQLFIDEMTRIEKTHHKNVYAPSNFNETILKLENISNLEDFSSEIGEIATAFTTELIPMYCINLFFGCISAINKIKKSDLNYLKYLSRDEIREIDRVMRNNSDEINQMLFGNDYQDINYIEMLKSRYYNFLKEIGELEKERLYTIEEVCSELKRDVHQISQLPIIGGVLAYSSIDELIYQYLQKLKKIAQNMYDTYPDKLFKIIKKLIYLGVENYENEAFFSELYYKSHTDPAYGVIFYGKDIEGLKILLNNFPNESNNVLVKLYIYQEEGKIEEIKKLSTEITKIEYNEYFIKIVETLFEEFYGKEQSFFINIQLLFSEQSKKDILLILKGISKKLEEDINTDFWGKNKENEDFKKLIQKYNFLNKEDNIKFSNESYSCIEELLKYYAKLQEILKENKKLEDLINIFQYIENLKKDKGIFDLYFIDEIEEEKDRKKKALDIDSFYWKKLDKLRNIKEKFSKYKDTNLEKNELIKKFIEKIRIEIEEIKLLISVRIEKYEPKLSSLENDKEKVKKEKAQINMYKNIIRFFKELENF